MLISYEAAPGNATVIFVHARVPQFATSLKMLPFDIRHLSRSAPYVP